MLPLWEGASKFWLIEGSVEFGCVEANPDDGCAPAEDGGFDCSLAKGDRSETLERRFGEGWEEVRNDREW